MHSHRLSSDNKTWTDPGLISSRLETSNELMADDPRHALLNHRLHSGSDERPVHKKRVKTMKKATMKARKRVEIGLRYIKYKIFSSLVQKSSA